MYLLVFLLLWIRGGFLRMRTTQVEQDIFTTYSAQTFRNFGVQNFRPTSSSRIRSRAARVDHSDPRILVKFLEKIVQLPLLLVGLRFLRVEIVLHHKKLGPLPQYLLVYRRIGRRGAEDELNRIQRQRPLARRVAPPLVEERGRLIPLPMREVVFGGGGLEELHVFLGGLSHWWTRTHAGTVNV